MKPEAQRIAIAEACGVIKCDKLGDWYYRMDDHNIDCVANDPLADLNAMHEAEKKLAEDQRFTFLDELVKVVCGFGPKFADAVTDDVAMDIISATASQRAEAFLRTIGKWDENSRTT